MSDQPESAHVAPSFEPDRLRLARELRGLNQGELAVQSQVTSAAISQFEAGSTSPSQKTLERMAAVLKIPPTFFGLGLLETHEGFFRSLRRTSIRQRRQARAIAYIAHDVAILQATEKSQLWATIPRIRIDSLDANQKAVEAVAEQVRSEWKMPRGPIGNVVQELEDHGVVVIRMPMASEDVDAFSLPFPDRPVVVLAADKNDRARSRFDGAHELGHLVMHGDQMWGIKEVERQAHEFAAAFLMPESDIASELPARADWPVLFELKRKWQVSLAALLMRARKLGKMSETAYLAAVKETSARGWRRVEPIPLGQCEAPTKLMRSIRGTRDADRLPEDVLEFL